MSEDLEVRNMAFTPGMELYVRGVVKSPVVRFSINVGHSKDIIALHFNPRFSYHGDIRTIVMNSRKDEAWQEELRSKEFPFEAGQEFEVTILFNTDTFDIYLSNGNMVQFPNRLGSQKYKCIFFVGDATIRDISVRET